VFTPPPPLALPFKKFGRDFTGNPIEYSLSDITKLYDGPEDGVSGFDPRINYSKELRRLNKMLLEQYTNILQGTL
jgi:hypothetical protein